MAEERDTLLKEKTKMAWDTIPDAPWATAIPSAREPSRYLPQAIAHRGYKASWPENTMGAFKGAVHVGAHAIETDVHLTRDGVAVLSHDATLVRCFGVNKSLKDCDWDYLSTLETLREPKQGLPRLQDLLEWLAQEDQLAGDHESRTWVLLDIKLDDDPHELVSAISAAISQVYSSTPWQKRIVLGCWNASVLQAAHDILPSFPLAHIGYSLSYARHFLPVSNMAFNMAFHTLVRPIYGRRFMRDLLASGRPLYAWTVNHPRWMKWCIRQNVRRPLQQATPDSNSVKAIDGVVTDDPKLFLEICRRWEDELDGSGVGEKRGALGEAVELVLDIVKRHLSGKLIFWYRRHVQGKLDYLDKERVKRD
ncbi:Lysophospholipase D gdpd1 [Conoideocrella luteorostrata]|uniref:Lysophospholipase D gdpd1 n=1 Tax=Conoideocrella luteorostrata TaxID=1105319 RepID=A0AAJ0CWK1_9HYPO|nr:Lysophospholipase D gdpd1 [Conoideocrella luteorostrata]